MNDALELHTYGDEVIARLNHLQNGDKELHRTMNKLAEEVAEHGIRRNSDSVLKKFIETERRLGIFISNDIGMKLVRKLVIEE